MFDVLSTVKSHFGATDSSEDILNNNFFTTGSYQCFILRGNITEGRELSKDLVLISLTPIYIRSNSAETNGIYSCIKQV